MKRFLTAALALSLLGATAAQADPFYGPRYGHSERYDRHDYDRGRDFRHHDNTGTAIAVGVGLIALTAILASQHNDRDRGYDRTEVRYEEDNYGPPPAPDYGPGPHGFHGDRPCDH